MSYHSICIYTPKIKTCLGKLYSCVKPTVKKCVYKFQILAPLFHLPSSHTHIPGANTGYKETEKELCETYSQQGQVVMMKVPQHKADKKGVKTFPSAIKVLGLYTERHFTHLPCISILNKLPCLYLKLSKPSF